MCHTDELKTIMYFEFMDQFFSDDAWQKMMVVSEYIHFMQKSKAEIIAEENNKRLKIKEEMKEQEQWKTLQISTEKEIKANLTVGINKLEKFLKNLKSKSVKFSVELSGLSACLEVWKEHCKKQGMITKCMFSI